MLIFALSSLSCVKDKPDHPIIVEGKDWIWVKKGDMPPIPFDNGACVSDYYLGLCAGIERE